MARFVRPRFQPQKSKRQFTWLGGVQTAFDKTDVAAGASVIFSSIDTRTGGAPQPPWTITRVRGLITIVSDQVAATEQPHGAMGMAVVNGEAFDAGVASIPTPFTESFDDRWFYHTYFSAPFALIGAAAMARHVFQKEIDGKAMRKVDIGDVVVVVIENGSSVGGIISQVNFRTGVKLH